MTPDERETMNQICIRIQTEKNPQVFEELIRQLNELLDAKRDRIDPERKT